MVPIKCIAYNSLSLVAKRAYPDIFFNTIFGGAFKRLSDRVNIYLIGI